MELLIEISKVIDNSADIAKALEELEKYELLVGFPEETESARTDTDLSNAEIGYIQDQGSPAKNIPPRPFLEPGVLSVEDQIEAQLHQAALAAIEEDPGVVERRFHAAGLAAQAGIRNYITNGTFAPLSRVTLLARRRRGFMGEKPLIETGQLRAAVTYVLRK